MCKSVCLLASSACLGLVFGFGQATEQCRKIACGEVCALLDLIGARSPMETLASFMLASASSAGHHGRSSLKSTCLSTESVLAFERNGHVALRGVLPPNRVHDIIPSLLAAYDERLVDVYKHRVRTSIGEEEVLDAEEESRRDGSAPLIDVLKQRLEQVPTESIPFLQDFNLWRRSADIAELASCPELASIASQLLGVEKVRLYQDSLFVKRPGDDETRWHSDLSTSPLDTNSFVTVWLPLQDIPSEEDGGTGLVFASGSHKDVALHFWHGHPDQMADCSGRYEESKDIALKVGDSTWHHGWTMHCAPPNDLETPRRALAISYFADGATRLNTPLREPYWEDLESYTAWLRDVPPGAHARHELLPLVWDATQRGPLPIRRREHRSAAPTKKRKKHRGKSQGKAKTLH